MSPIETASSWLDFARRRQQSRELGVEGFMLKRLDAAYGTGRTKADGLWWKCKIDPMTIDCVLVYAQAGHGRRASVYTDYTFAVWNRDSARTRTGKPEKRSENVSKCCWTSSVVGTSTATCLPSCTALNAARTAISVLP